MRAPRPTYANVTASIALFIALGGTSYAITKLPKDSVGSAQVRDGSLQRKDLGASVVRAPVRGPRGTEGPRGPQGDRGSQGERGPSGVRIAPRAPNITLSGLAEQESQVRRMDNVPAGAWLLKFDANAYLGAPTAVYAICAIKVNGDVRVDVAAVVGQAGNGVGEVPIPIETAVQQPAPFNVTVDCRQNATTTPAVIIAGAQIIALQVADLVKTP